MITHNHRQPKSRQTPTTAFTQDVYMHSVPALEESAADQIADLIFGLADEDERPD